MFNVVCIAARFESVTTSSRSRLKSLAMRSNLILQNFQGCYLPRKIKLFNDASSSMKRNDLVDYAWKVSNGNLDFILTIEGESSFNPKAIGDNGNSVWLCQRHQKRQAETRKNPNFKDPKRQVEQCRKNYSQRVKDWIIHKRLYAYNWRKNTVEILQENNNRIKLYWLQSRKYHNIYS